MRCLGFVVLLVVAGGVLSDGCGSTSTRAQIRVQQAPRLASVRQGDVAKPTIGEVLSTTNGTWTHSPTSYAYQWQRCSPCANISGDTSRSYTVQSADRGSTIRVVVRAFDVSGSASQISAQTGTVTSGGGPANTAMPVVSGVADTASFAAPQFAATSGSWSGSPTKYTYQWQDCNSSGGNCVNAAGMAYGPGATGSKCVNAHPGDGCRYNLVADEAAAPCPYAFGAAGSCTIRLALTASSGRDTTVTTSQRGPVTASTPAHPNFSNTGYQNAPGYPGTPGIPDPSKLTLASSGSSTCPTSIESNHTYSFCHYTSELNVGSSSGHVSNVHFIGDLFEDPDPHSYGILMYCDSSCTIDYATYKPARVNAPDLPGHGTTWGNSVGMICDCGMGSYNSVGHGVSITHSDMWGWDSGIILGPNTSATPINISDNWLHDQGDCEHDSGCSTHADGIGMVDTGGSSSYVTINHNNMPFIHDNTNDIAFQSGTYDNLTITNNVFSGDGYTVAVWSTSTNITFTGNIWTNYAQEAYGPLYPQDFYDTPGSTWAHNKFMWDPTGVSPFEGGKIRAAANGKCWTPSGLSTTDYGGGTC